MSLFGVLLLLHPSEASLQTGVPPSGAGSSVPAP
jgi:hypothetical protein